MSGNGRPKVNPLSRRPRQQRLVMAVRGGAGVGKSHFIRSMADAGLGRFSADTRYIAFMSNEADVDKGEVYVRPFDPNKPDAPVTGPAMRVSKDGAIGMIAWRQDGKELYYMTRNWEVMAVDIETTPTFKAGTPRMLFSLPGPLPGNPLQWKNVSPDGQRFLFAMPTNATGSASR